MASYRLFHLDGAALNDAGRDEDLFQVSFGDADAARLIALADAGYYREAARFEADPKTEAAHVMEQIWVATQNIDTEGWADAPAPDVAPSAPRQRSTSVGDLVVTPDGRLYVCARIGWREIGAAPAALTPAAA